MAAERRAEDDRRKAQELDTAKKNVLARTRIGLVAASALLAVAVVLWLSAQDASHKNATLNADMQVQLEDAASRALGRANDAKTRNDSGSYYAYLAESLSFAPSAGAIGVAEMVLQYPVYVPEGRLPRSVFWLPESVKWLSISPDGTRVLVMEDDRNFTAQIYDLQSGKPLGKRMPHGAGIIDSDFSADGKLVATASHDLMVRLWDATSGLPIGEALRHDSLPVAVRISADARWLVTLDENPNRTPHRLAHVWDTATRRRVGNPLAHGDLIVSADFSSDGTKILTRSSDLNEAQIWDARTTSSIGKPMKHANRVSAARFSPDGRSVVTTSGGVAQIWHAATGEPFGESLLFGITEDIKFLEFSPNARWFATASHSPESGYPRLKIWDARTGAVVAMRQMFADIFDVRYSGDSRWMAVATSDGTTHILEAETGNPVGAPMRDENHSLFSIFSSDGRWLLAVQNEKVVVWPTHVDAALGEDQAQIDFPLGPRLSPDNRMLLVGRTRSSLHQKDVDFMDLQTQKLIGQAIRHDSSVASFQFSPDGTKIVTASGEVAQQWDAITRKPVGQAMKHLAAVQAAVYSPNGRWIATASSFPLNAPVSIIRLWDADNDAATEIKTPIVHTGRLNHLDFSPDGKKILSASNDGTVRLWDLMTGESSIPLMRHDGSVKEAVFSPDGLWIATRSDQNIRVWSARTGEEIGRTMNHANVASLAFSPDGRRLVSGTDDGNFRFWDAQHGIPAGNEIHPIHLAAFPRFFPDPEGRWIVSVGMKPEAPFQRWSAFTDLGADQHRLASALRAFSGSEIDTHGQSRNLTFDERANARTRLLNSATGSTAFDQAIRWHFDDPYTRTISPFAEQTVPQYVESTIATGLAVDCYSSNQRKLGLEVLNEAYNIDPGHPLILLALSVCEEHPATVQLWRELTLQRIAKDARLAAKAAEILQRQGDVDNARRAAEIALMLDPNNELAKTYADTPITNKNKTFDIYQKMSAVLRSRGEGPAGAASAEALRDALEASDLLIYENIEVVNWQLETAGLRCESSEIKTILALLNTSTIFRFYRGLQFDCNDKDLIFFKHL